jgi:lipoprotein Spr
VGIYLQNNKFIHASTSFGVTISDLFDPYYLGRFLGVGRIDKPEVKIK